MTAPRDPDRLIHAFLLEGAEQLHDQVFDAVRADIEHRRQRAVIGPWRIPALNKFVPFGLGAAAVVVALVIGVQVFAPPAPDGVGGAPSAEPSPTTPPSPSASPNASPAVPPALTETFTSERHGISISYPAGWKTRPATEPWTSSIPDYVTAGGDVVYHPTHQASLWLMVASQPQAGKGGRQWVDDLLAELGSEDECGPPGDSVAIDGIQGQWCGENVVAVSSGDRGYVIRLYTSGDDPAIGDTYDRAWFEQVLATVQLRPEDAVDVAPSAVP